MFCKLPTYDLRHPISVDLSKYPVCVLTGKVLPEHTGKESEDELGHQDVWELIVPGLGILFLDSEGELRCTGSFMRIYCLTSAFEENSLEKVALKIKQELIEAELLYGSR